MIDCMIANELTKSHIAAQSECQHYFSGASTDVSQPASQPEPEPEPEISHPGHFGRPALSQ